MKEKDFQTKFNLWCKYRTFGNAVFELKLSRGTSLPFNDVVEHQVNALLNAKHNRVIHKISDAGFQQNPFDSFQVQEVGAFVVIMFGENKKEFFMIDIDRWQKEKKISERKSLTESRAKEIGITCALA